MMNAILAYAKIAFSVDAPLDGDETALWRSMRDDGTLRRSLGLADL